MVSEITTDRAPSAIGPYSQGIVTDQFIFVSGQIPVDPRSGEIPPTIEAQAERAFENLSAILKSAGSSLSKVVKTTVFLKDMNDFAAVNRVYERYFTRPYPARSCVAVAGLPKDVPLEAEAIAVR